nr:MAG TPA: hypothetical protein [Caudoviricetes sp.]
MHSLLSVFFFTYLCIFINYYVFLLNRLYTFLYTSS